MKLELIVKKDSILKQFLLDEKLSRAFCRKVKLYGTMYINGTIAKNYFPVKTGDIVTLEYDEKENIDIIPVSYDLDIVYEDEYFMVINKPSNLACQPSKKHYTDNLVSMLRQYFIDKAINSNIHLVNRLDMATSGLIIIAKNGYIHNLFSKVLISKTYYCLVDGYIDIKSGVIKLAIARDLTSPIKRKVSDEGKMSITEYEVISEKNNQSLVKVNLITGRTHQIRVHFAYLNHPLVGDQLYNPNSESQMLYLHCYQLKFNHPITNKELLLKVNPKWEKNIFFDCIK